MNIIYMHTHDSGRYIQPYGHAIPTPNLQELAQGGVLFRRCFSCAPTCSPSRAALLTGMNPHSTGMMGLTHRGFKLTNPTQHLASHLRANGFETVLCGEQHVITHGQEEKLGYTRILTCENQGENPADIRNIMSLDITNAQAVSRYLEETPNKPFFLSFGMVGTHFPLPEPDADINPGYVQPPPTLPDNEVTRHDMAGYMTLARNADRCVGIVLDALEANHLQEDTLVIFTTDHGVAFPKMKCTLLDEGIGVSLILRFPQGKYAGQVVDAMVSHLDVYPTLCHLVGTEPPTWLEGYSLVPLLDGKVDQVRDQVFAEVTYHAAYEPMRCIRTERYKYIRYFDEYEMVIKPNIDASSSKRFLIEHGLLTRAHDPKEMLFDLYYDPRERDNLAEHFQYQEIKTKLAARLKDWMESTSDPLILGPVDLPDGVYTNNQGDLHPS